jgi:hypothetical protein
MSERIQEFPKTCEHCGVKFRRPRFANGVLESMNRYKKRRYCSLRCANLAQRKQLPLSHSILCQLDIEKRADNLRNLKWIARSLRLSNSQRQEVIDLLTERKIDASSL